MPDIDIGDRVTYMGELLQGRFNGMVGEEYAEIVEYNNEGKIVGKDEFPIEYLKRADLIVTPPEDSKKYYIGPGGSISIVRHEVRIALRRLAQEVLPEFTPMNEYADFEIPVLEEMYEFVTDQGLDLSFGRLLLNIDALTPDIMDYVYDNDVDPRKITLEIDIPELEIAAFDDTHRITEYQLG